MRLGADPELFAIQEDIHEDYKFKSVIGLIGGTKWNPLPIEGEEGFYIQEDNVALEYNIPPADSALMFTQNVRKGLYFCKQALNKYNFRVSDKASAIFTEDEMNDPRAFIFGCEPDFNAWTLEENPKPNPDNPFLRCCGGHVHIEAPDLDPIELVKWLDFYLGLSSVMHDRDTERKKMYGKAGAFRPKDYGVEYRVLSNFWIFSDKYCNFVWEQCKEAINKVRNKIVMPNALGERIQYIINNNKVHEASIVKSNLYAYL